MVFSKLPVNVDLPDHGSLAQPFCRLRQNQGRLHVIGCVVGRARGPVRQGGGDGPLVRLCGKDLVLPVLHLHGKGVGVQPFQ